MLNWGSVVGIVTRLRVDDLEFESSQDKHIFLFLKLYIPALGFSLPSIQRILGFLFGSEAAVVCC